MMCLKGFVVGLARLEIDPVLGLYYCFFLGGAGRSEVNWRAPFTVNLDIV
tara:strand:- start:340 stop:489 length:150 start_codon:yes stop_codon:yes gene_type:complete